MVNGCDFGLSGFIHCKFHLHPWFLDGVNFAIARWSILGEDSKKQFLWEYPVVLVRAMLNFQGMGLRFKTAKNCSHLCIFFVAKFRAMPRVLYAQNDNLQYTKLSIPLFCIGFAARWVRCGIG